MEKDRLEGIWAATLTPLKSDLKCDHDALAHHCLELLEKGCDGVVLFGTSGEGPSFTVKERIEALNQVIHVGVPREQIILGNGNSNLPDTIDLAKACVQSEIAAFLVGPPSFFKNIQEEGLLNFYRALATGVDAPALPIILYHIPQYSGVPFTIAILEKLRQELPSIVGIKESEGNQMLIEAIQKRMPQFKLFIGNEKYLIDSVKNGVSGGILGIANLYPEQIVQLYQAAQKGQKVDSATLEGLSQAIKQYPFIAAAKAILERHKGTIWQRVRPPLVPLTEKEKERLFSSLQKI